MQLPCFAVSIYHNVAGTSLVS